MTETKVEKYMTNKTITVGELVKVLGDFDSALPVVVQSWEGETLELDHLTEVERINVKESSVGSRSDYRWPFRPDGETVSVLLIR